MKPHQTTHPTTYLHFREGSSDKVYHASIEPQGDGFALTFAYGRRGSPLTTGTKTQAPVPLAEAEKIHAKLIASKLAKGYRPDGAAATPYQHDGSQGNDTGIRCQLLNPVEEGELERLLANTRHCLQEKFDGRRLMVRKQGSTITGINRRGLTVGLPQPILEAARQLPVDALIDGEAVGDTLHAFDLLEVAGIDIRERRYLDRFNGLLRLLEPEDAIRPVETATEPEHKQSLLAALRQRNSEGIVLKEIDASFSPGRPATGGSQLKFKFVESASFLVTGHNAKRSVTLGLFDSDTDDWLPAGNVTIPPNHLIPELGQVVEVRYLYAFPESGAIFQPVYLGPRDDISPIECVRDQLKFKPEPHPALRQAS